MKSHRYLNVFLSLLAVVSLSLGGISPTPVGALAENKSGTNPAPQAQAGAGNSHGTVTPADRQAAAARAARARADGRKTTAQMLAAASPVMDPGGVPDYFGTTSNYANSPLPASVGISGDGTGASAVATLTSAGAVAGITMTSTGSGYTNAATSVLLIGGGGTGALLKAVINEDSGAITSINVVSAGSGYNTTSGIRKFVDSLPGLTSTGINDLGQYMPVAVEDTTTYPGSDYYEIAAVEYAQKLHKDLPPTLLREYVQISTSVVPGKHIPLTYPNGNPIVDYHGNPVYAVDDPQYLGPIIVAGTYDPTKPAGQNGNGKPTRIKFTNYLPTGSGGDLFIPVDTTEMGAGEGPTGEVTAIKLLSGGAGYTSVPTVTISGGGASTTATADATILNGVVNTLHITNPGTGYTSAPSVSITGGGATTNAVASLSWVGSNPGTYTENRAVVHLHGGVTPWISDGTPDQWVTPANENTPYPVGVSAVNVPDMPDPGPGSTTLFYTNEQSARLMFYHDHAYGITRLDVYAGEAAGYLVTDPVEQTLINGGTIPGTSVNVPAGTIPAAEIPLIIQDKTFIPSQSQLALQDPTWNWGSTPGTVHTGDLWFPHVYMPNQNPFDAEGVNAMGRWDYGPWFWPPFNTIAIGPQPNPLYPSLTNPLEGPVNPGTPNPSLVPEGYMDTPLINGTVYPFLDVTRQPYRFRILNAANDRFFNLQLYCAKSNGTMWDSGTGALLDANAGEVSMVPAVETPGFPSTWPTDLRAGGVPDPATAGPDLIQIGTEGGLMPVPAVIPSQPIGYLYDRRNIVVLNVTDKALFLGPAERADVIVDFSQVPASCSTLILYNDSPAPVPAFDPRNDYFTGDPDNTGVGGAPSTLPGYGPNTRTLMQIRVTGNPSTPYNLGALQTALPAAFAASQPAPIVPQSDYDAAYQASYPTDAFARIQDLSMTFTPAGSTAINVINVTAAGIGYTSAPVVDLVGGSGSGATATASIAGGQVTSITITNGGSGYTGSGLPTVAFTGGGGVGAAASASVAVTMPLQPKAIQELFTLDYGRMNATLGVEIPSTNGTNQTTIPYGYVDPPTELVQNSDPATPLGTLDDGTQIWKITHNGVDTHAIHVHLFNAQLINRVGWDGAIRPPDPNEIGWKDTIRMNPLEDAIIALRPIVPVVPFKVPNSIRAMDVTKPVGSSMGFWGQDPLGNPVTILNQLVNFGWEYVWHCHLLGHEENDMMRPIIIAVKPQAPSGLTVTRPGGGAFRLNLAWNDNSLNATGFTIQRALDPGFTTELITFTVAKAQGIPQAYTDTTPISGTLYYYRVVAIDEVGGITDVPTEPSMTATSTPSNVVKYPTNRYTITVISPHGTIVKNPSQASYASGASVSLTATAFSGWTFTNWTGNVPSSPNANNPVNVTVTNADLTITANYTPTNPKISGNAGVGAALITYTGGSTVADGTGNYSFSVAPGWNGTVTPSKTGYIFSPSSKNYTNVRANQTAQDYIATLLTYTISGNTGVGGVTLSYTDGTDKLVNSDVNGAYSILVSYNWTGTVTPSKTGYTFAPTSRPYSNVLGNQPSQNYVATPILFSITGNAGVANAVLSYNDGTPKTVFADGTGAYTLNVVYNWSGTVTPSLPGFVFAPVSRVYTPVFANKTSQDYVASPTPYTISGNAGVAGAVLNYTDVVAKTAIADVNGNYALTVTPGWTGTVTPSLTGYTFLPLSLSYNNLVVSVGGQNYTAMVNTYTISGNVGVANATLSYNNGSPQTVQADPLGNYSFTIPYSTVPITVTPTLTNYTFSPVNRIYLGVTANLTTQDYIATANIHTISGNAGIPYSVMSYNDGTPKTVTADAIGNYSFAIPYSSLPVTVTPSLAGYTFQPVNRTYFSMLTDQTAQDYTASIIMFTISGNAGVPDAVLSYMDGTLKTVSADGTGAYSLQVPYNWTGTVRPSLYGYYFAPVLMSYTNVLADQTAQDYTVVPAVYQFMPFSSWP